MFKTILTLATYLVCSYSAAFSISGTVQDASVMEAFLCDAKNYFADKQSTGFESVNESCELLQKIKNEFNSGLLVEIQHRFFRLSKAFADKQVGEFALSDLRFLNERIDKFNRFIEKFVDKNKARLRPEELELLDNLEKFCSILKNMLKKENFDIDALDKIVDKVTTQPAHFVANNPGVAAIMATPFVLYGLYRLASEKEESEIVNGFYVSTPVHVDGIPDGVYSEVNVEMQERCDCGAAATARALQKILGITDNQTVAFRKQKYLEWDLIIRQTLEYSARSRIPLGSSALFDWLFAGVINRLIRAVNKKIAEDSNKILTFDYCTLVQFAKQRIGKPEYDPCKLTVECYAKKLSNFKNDMKYPIGCSMHVVNHVSLSVSNIRLNHCLYYELKKIAPASSTGKWFTICCEDTLRMYNNRRLGAYALYNWLCSDNMSWVENVPDIK